MPGHSVNGLIDWSWFATPNALALGVWVLGLAFALGVLTEWVKLMVQVVRYFRGLSRHSSPRDAPAVWS